MNSSQLFHSTWNQLLVLSIYLIITSFVPPINSLPTASSSGPNHERGNRQLGLLNNGFGMSMSESMASSMNNGFGGMGMGMGMSGSMAMDAGIRNVNGFPMPYFDASMSMSESSAASNNFPTYG